MMTSTTRMQPQERRRTHQWSSRGISTRCVALVGVAAVVALAVMVPTGSAAAESPPRLPSDQKSEQTASQTTSIISENTGINDKIASIQIPLSISDGSTVTSRIVIAPLGDGMPDAQLGSAQDGTNRGSKTVLAAFAAGVGSAALFISLWYRRRE
jgi:hypothetical protein